MERAKLDIDDQHPRVRLRPYDVAGELECIDSRATAHETDQGALDVIWQVAALDEVEVDAWRVLSSTARDQEVGDAIALGAERELLDRCGGEHRCMMFVRPHARGGVREMAEPIEFVAVGDSVERQSIRWQAGIAVRNARAFYHSVEQPCFAAIISELKACKVHKRPMDVIRRHRRHDTIDISQVTPPLRC